jgi:glucan biosynthesis protein C
MKIWYADSPAPEDGVTNNEEGGEQLQEQQQPTEQAAEQTAEQAAEQAADAEQPAAEVTPDAPAHGADASGKAAGRPPLVPGSKQAATAAAAAGKMLRQPSHHGGGELISAHLSEAGSVPGDQPSEWRGRRAALGRAGLGGRLGAGQRPGAAAAPRARPACAPRGALRPPDTTTPPPPPPALTPRLTLPPRPAPPPGGSEAPDCMIVFDANKDASAPGAKLLAGPADDAVSVGGASAATAAPGGRRRSYYIDWLRAFLTLVVVVHHCVTAYLGSSPWAKKKKDNDNALWLLFQLFVVGNQAYFMTVFFFISGLYVPASLRRKGAAKFLADRTLRLVLPCIVYSSLVPPFTMYWNDLAAGKPGDIGNAFRVWFKPGWPTTYVLPTGPPWFVWMLWCFNVAYVILARLAALPPARALFSRLPRAKDSSGSLPMLAAVGLGHYSARQTAIGAAAITCAFTGLQYAVRMLNNFAFDVKPASFISRGPFVAFMPDFFVVYVVAFGLGIYATPRALNRLPAGWAGWCLSGAGVWWLLAGWIPNITLHGVMAAQAGAGPFAGAWLLRTFVEQSFCVAWSLGLIVLFRDAFNARPNALGRQVIGAAYGAYLVHPILILFFARAAMGLAAPSYVVNAAAIAAPVAVCSWLVAAALRAIPGADRVL